MDKHELAKLRDAISNDILVEVFQCKVDPTIYLSCPQGTYIDCPLYNSQTVATTLDANDPLVTG